MQSKMKHFSTGFVQKRLCLICLSRVDSDSYLGIIEWNMPLNQFLVWLKAIYEFTILTKMI